MQSTRELTKSRMVVKMIRYIFFFLLVCLVYVKFCVLCASVCPNTNGHVENKCFHFNMILSANQKIKTINQSIHKHIKKASFPDT